MSNYGESATIKKPEVGDVWIYENHLYRISKIEDKEDGFGKSYIAEDLLTRINAAIDESGGK